MHSDDQSGLIKAFDNGKAVQFRSARTDSEWKECVNPIWDFNSFEYRIKPDPTYFWINLYTDGKFTCHLNSQDATKQRGKNGKTVKVMGAAE